MSIYDTFKFIGDIFADFVTWEGSGIVFLIFMFIPISMFVAKVIFELFGGINYHEEKK